MAFRALPSRDYIQQALAYDPATGVFRWRVRPPAHFLTKRAWAICNARCAGKIAGSLDNRGHTRLVLGNRIFYAHRIAWLLMHGDPVPDIIDHIDGAPANNRISNLRAATPVGNAANAKTSLDNRLGLKGIRVHASGKFEVRIQHNRKTHHVGHFATLEEATAARREAAERLHGEFARHE